MSVFRQIGYNSHLKRYDGRSWNSKKRTDTKVEQGCKEVGKSLSHKPCHIGHTGSLAYRHCHNGKQGQTHSRNTESQTCQECFHSRLLSHGNRENQISRSEKHAKKHGCHKYYFSKTYLFFHKPLPTSPCGACRIFFYFPFHSGFFVPVHSVLY